MEEFFRAGLHFDRGFCSVVLSHIDPFCFSSKDTIQTYTSVKEQIHSIDFQSETVGEIQDDDQQLSNANVNLKSIFIRWYSYLYLHLYLV